MAEGAPLEHLSLREAYADLGWVRYGPEVLSGLKLDDDDELHLRLGLPEVAAGLELIAPETSTVPLQVGLWEDTPLLLSEHGEFYLAGAEVQQVNSKVGRFVRSLLALERFVTGVLARAGDDALRLGRFTEADVDTLAAAFAAIEPEGVPAFWRSMLESRRDRARRAAARTGQRGTLIASVNCDPLRTLDLVGTKEALLALAHAIEAHAHSERIERNLAYEDADWDLDWPQISLHIVDE